MTTLVSITNDVISINLSGVGPQGASGVGVPVGGTAGQVLAKNSTTNYDTLWQTPGSGLLASANNLSDVASATAARSNLGLGGLATLSLSSVNAWTGQQYFPQAALTDGTTISWNVSTQQAAGVTLGGSRTLANPTNIQAGGTYTLIVKQDATGGRTLSYGTAYKWPGGSAPTLSTAASAVDILTFLSDGTSMYGVAQKAFA